LDGNQQQLYSLEKLCTKENPPAAMAGCPLHINCRSICEAISNGDFNEARTLYQKSAVFPGILSRLCEAPCQKACIRKDKGGAIQMRVLEEAAVSFGQIKQRRAFLPRKNQRIAVIGGGITAMTAAIELGKKGYAIVMIEKNEKLGGMLRKCKTLPEDILDQEIKSLDNYKVEIQIKTTVDDIETVKKEYDAVYIAWGLKKSSLSIDSESFWCEEKKVFAGGDALRKEHGTLVESMSEGRRAAISIDRYLNQVSMMAGRAQEGVFDSTLCVNTENEPDQESASTPPYNREEAAEEAKRCFLCTCTYCTDACAFMRYYKAYPKKYLREVYNNLSIAMGTRHANAMINSCSLCSQCAALCPQGLDLGSVIKEARHAMTVKDKMPPSAFEFALNDMQYSNSPKCFLARHQPSFNTSGYAFFPGCQLPASAPDTVKKAYLDLSEKLTGGVGLILGCCGIIADWAGRTDLYQNALLQIKTAWEEMGKPIMILACPSCYATFGKEIPMMECIGIWNILKDTNLPENFQKQSGAQIIHDACGARYFPQIQKDVRTLVAKMGYELTEGTYAKEETGCCGYGGLTQYSNPAVAAEITKQCTEDPEAAYLTYCANCRERFVKAGVKSMHILELLYDTKTAKERKSPSYSLRQDNRLNLTNHLLKELWKTDIKEESPVELAYSREVEQLLEERLILESDIRAVINDAEKENCWIKDVDSGLRIAHKQVGNVTFWVYYQKHGEQYQIERSYGHRMEIKGE